MIPPKRNLKKTVHTLNMKPLYAKQNALKNSFVPWC